MWIQCSICHLHGQPHFADLHVFVPKETIEYPIPHCYSAWSAMLPVFTCSVNSCPCDNTYGRPFDYCMCVE